MFHLSSSPWARRAWLLLVTALMPMAVLVACGGGGGGVGSGGTGSFAVGTITGFGSVIVNGIRFDDSAATVLDDEDAAGSPDDLRLGMVVEVTGSALAPDTSNTPGVTRSGVANTIRYGSEVLGRLEAVDVAARTLTVLGQLVDVTAATVYDTALAGGLPTLAALPPGTQLEVYGFFDAAGDGRHRATRIELADAATVFKLRGEVRDLDVDAKTFRIGAALVSFAPLTAQQAGAQGIAEGQLVRLRLQRQPVGGFYPLESARSDQRQLPDLDDVEIEGLVSDFTSAQSFSVDGIPVDARSAEFDGDPTQIGLGSRVEVEGSLRNGVLIAREVELEDDDDDDDESGNGGTGALISLSGQVENLDTVNQRFTLRGVVVNYANAEFDDGDVDDLSNPDVEVEVEGRLAPDGSTVNAIEIEIDD